MKLPLANWVCSRKERKYVNDVLTSGWLTYGPWQKRLESMWSAYHGCEYGVVNSSGTGALQVAFRALKEAYKWENDSEVICPAITFPATINMVIESGLRPVLCDVDFKDGMISVEDLEKRITVKTRAICLVHLWGTPCPRSAEIKRICQDRGIHIVEDSCETIDKSVGHIGDVSCFSMYFNHIISAGVGGMACTNDQVVERIMRSLCNHGMIDTTVKPKYKRFNFCRVGYSMRITELEAALAVAQFESIDKILAYRRKVSEWLTDEFWRNNIDNVSFIGGTMMYPMILPKSKSAKKIMEYLDKRGVETRTALPITNQAVYKDLVIGEYPNADIFNRWGIFLPIQPYMTKRHCVYAAKMLKEALECC